MTPINSFGAVFTFAISLETQLRGFYQAQGDAAHAAEADKRRSNLERVRRENVVEITLEPIEGLFEENYALSIENESETDAANLERIAAQFYEDAAPKVNVRQARRTLEKYAQVHFGQAHDAGAHHPEADTTSD